MSSQDNGVGGLTPALFEQLYRQYAGPLCGYLARNLRGDMAEAQGVAQEAFVRAWEKRADLRDPSTFRSWLYAIALNVLRQRKRRLRPLAVSELDPTSPEPCPESVASTNQALAQVLACMDQLPEEQSQAIWLVRVEGMKFKEAAEALEAPVNTVKTWVRRGLLKLAEELPGLSREDS